MASQGLGRGKEALSYRLSDLENFGSRESLGSL